jgi:DNA topoisomerase III
MKVVLAEKPSVARDIAAVLGATNKRDGYYEGNDYAVTYAFGHLVTIAEPEEMNPLWGKPWRIAQLPMIPEAWKYRVSDKTGNQFQVIKRLFSDPATTTIICATDAGREGEHIFRLIHKLAGSKKPVQRLWISSLTADAIRDGFRKLKPGSDFDNLADAAAGRAHADWIVGLNFTRAYTTINNQLCTIGRVQTPTLALIVDRQKAIDDFKQKAFFEVLVTFEPGFTALYITPGAEPQTRLQDKPSAQAVMDAIAAKPSGSVVSISTSEKRTKAPALYDLLTLQKDANKRFGYTAQETLDIAQNLYEEYKLISYPRTESRHLSTDMIDTLPAIVSTLLQSPLTTAETRKVLANEGLVPGKITVDLLNPRLNKSYVDNAKLTDHHAIIPTNKVPGKDLPLKQRNIYQLIATRFLCIFLPAEIRDETTAIIKIAEHSFRARGVVIKQAGWTVLDQRDPEKEKEKKKDESEATQQLPPLTKGQEVAKRKAELKQGKTTPPKPYDDSTLLTAMKNAGQEIDDEDLAAYMKQSGLGTPATRAAIIERLLQTAYIERSKKAIIPTDKGKAIIDNVHPNLKNAALTANWEQQLAEIQDDKLTLSKFEDDIASFVRRLLPDVAKQAASVPGDAKTGIGLCPQCKIGVVRETPKGAGCSRWREGCTFTVWREQYGKKLSDAQIKEIVLKGRTKTIKGLKKKNGSGTYDAALVVGEDFKIRPDFGSPSSESADFGVCPQCKQGTVRSTPKGAGCSRWKEGCTFSIWREIWGKELTDDQIKELVQKRRTQQIKGFKKKDGSGTYDASLVLNDEFKVRLDFQRVVDGVEV